MPLKQLQRSFNSAVRTKNSGITVKIDFRIHQIIVVVLPVTGEETFQHTQRRLLEERQVLWDCQPKKFLLDSRDRPVVKLGRCPEKGVIG